MPTVTIKISPFANQREIKAAEIKKALLENAGYTLVHESALALVYQLKEQGTPTS